MIPPRATTADGTTQGTPFRWDGIVEGRSPTIAGIYSGTGVPTIGAAAGSLYVRTDTPGTSSQRLYFCTVSGAQGAATWVALAV